jgi:hypothetical protein
VLGGSLPERWTLEFLLRSALGELAS